VLVTGAGSGLGRAFCLALAKKGARVLASDIGFENVEETCRLAKAQGLQAAIARQSDVTKIEQVQALADEMQEHFGGVDLVINNAGVAAAGPIGKLPLEDWKWVMDVNLWGVIYGCHVFTPIFQAQKSGAFINIASAAGLLSPPTMAPYNVSKAGVIALSETLSSELRSKGIAVSVLCPTFFKTNIANASRSTEPGARGMVDRLMEKSKFSALDIANIALEAVEKNQLYVVPMADGRWFWRAKRALPERFAALLGFASRFR
jgi:NAD(P)-dependent dehydrogenase (short-subunit alcohol dehydrogenase family)